MSEVVREGRPVGGTAVEERIAPLDRLIGHVGQARGLTGEDLLSGQAVIGQVEGEFEHADRLRGLARHLPPSPTQRR